MRCKRVLRLMTDYVDGILGGVRSAGVRDHLDRCDACREEEDRARLVVECLETVPEVTPPEDGLHRLETRLAFLPPPPAAAPAGRLRTLVLPYCAGLATAAAILLLALPFYSPAQVGNSPPGADRPAANGTVESSGPELMPGERALSPAPRYVIDRRGNLIELPQGAETDRYLHRGRLPSGDTGLIQPVDYEER